MMHVRSVFLIVAAALLLSGAAGAADDPTFSVDWYGYVKLDLSRDQNQTNGNYALYVLPKAADISDDEQFNLTHRQSRLGIVARGDGYQGVDVAAKFEVDLYGAAGSETTMSFRLRQAYFTVTAGSMTMLAGQAWDLISPLNPATINFAVNWCAGNTGARRPQLSLRYLAPVSPTAQFHLAGGVFRPTGFDLATNLSLATAENISDGTDDGVDAGVPAFQGLMEFRNLPMFGGSVRAGFSGMYANLKAENGLGDSEKYDSWGVFGHVAYSYQGQFGVSGEVFRGSNLANYFGGIKNTDRVEGLNTYGGWLNGWAAVSQQVKLGIGGGFDDPDNDDLSNSSRASNQSVWANIKYYPVPKVMLGLELSQWKTEYKNAGEVDNFRVQSAFQLSF
jgi:hypothetical protein